MEVNMWEIVLPVLKDAGLGFVKGIVVGGGVAVGMKLVEGDPVPRPMYLVAADGTPLINAVTPTPTPSTTNYLPGVYPADMLSKKKRKKLKAKDKAKKAEAKAASAAAAAETKLRHDLELSTLKANAERASAEARIAAATAEKLRKESISAQSKARRAPAKSATGITV